MRRMGQRRKVEGGNGSSFEEEKTMVNYKWMFTPRLSFLHDLCVVLVKGTVHLRLRWLHNILP